VAGFGGCWVFGHFGVYLKIEEMGFWLYVGCFVG